MSAWTRSSTPAASAASSALDRRRRDALHEDAAQQLQSGGVAGTCTDDLDGHPERPEELGEALGARLRTRARVCEAGARDDADQRDVRELDRQRGGELPLELRGGGVQVGVERAVGELAGDARRSVEGEGRRVEAENDVGAR